MFDAASDREFSNVQSSKVYLFIRRPYDDEGNEGNALSNFHLLSRNNVARPHDIFISSSPEVQGKVISDFEQMTLDLIAQVQ
jgi:hypothetical protein